MGDRYAKNAAAVFSLKHHMVWCPKYPRSVLTHPIDARLKALFAEIVNRLKGRTSRVLRQEFPSLRSRLPTLWSRSSFAATVGAVSQNTIRGSIEAQKGG